MNPSRLAFAVLFALSTCPLFGCHQLAPAQQAKLDHFECQVAAVAPLVEPTLDAVQLVQDLYAGKADLGQVIGSLHATQEEIQALVARLKACDTAEIPVREPPTDLAPAVLRAPPPAYGNKVL